MAATLNRTTTDQIRKMVRLELVNLGKKADLDKLVRKVKNGYNLVPPDGVSWSELNSQIVEECQRQLE